MYPNPARRTPPEMKVVEITLVTHKEVPREYDLVEYQKKLKQAYAQMFSDPDIKIHIKG